MTLPFQEWQFTVDSTNCDSSDGWDCSDNSDISDSVRQDRCDSKQYIHILQNSENANTHYTNDSKYKISKNIYFFCTKNNKLGKTRNKENAKSRIFF